MALKKNDSTLTVADIIQATGGTSIGDSNREISGICSLDDPRAGCLSFSTSSSRRQVAGLLLDCPLDALLISASLEGPNSLKSLLPSGKAPTLILVDSPTLAFCKVIPLFYEFREPERVISDSARIDPSARIGKNVAIGDFCSVAADCDIADNAILFPHVTLYPGVAIGEGAIIHSQAVIREDCFVGKGCIIQNGAVVGADGFGYTACPEQGIRHVPQVGCVELSERVEIGANSCVDRATLEATKIGTGSKIDNLTQVGHNVQIGSYSILCGQIGIGGSCSIGSQVTIGGMTGVKDHTTIADGIRIAGNSGVVTDLVEKGDYAGFPATKAGEWKRLQTTLLRLPSIVKDLRRQARKK